MKRRLAKLLRAIAARLDRTIEAKKIGICLKPPTIETLQSVRPIGEWPGEGSYGFRSNEWSDGGGGVYL